MRSKRSSPDADELLCASCYLEGRSSEQDAHLTLLPDSTVHVLLNEGGLASRDVIMSSRQARRLLERLLRKNWKQVPRPRRTPEQLRTAIETACREFLSRPIRRDRDPDANVVPPEMQVRRQRERVLWTSAATTRGTRVIEAGAFESNKRRH